MPRPLAWIAAAAVALCAAPAPAAHELAKLHVLIVADTADKAGISDSAKKDLAAVRAMFTKNVPAERLSLKVLTGKTVTAVNILGYYKTLAAKPTDAVAFYYAGHGGRDAKGLFFALGQGGKQKQARFYRSELLTAIRAKNAGLSVVLTDCCSDRPAPRRSAEEDPEPDSKATVALDPNVRKLFFEARGLVDITAATNNKSYGTDLRGGLFTYALTDAVVGRGKPAKPVESWKALYSTLKVSVPSQWEYQVSRSSIEPEPNERPQTPKYYSLGDSGGKSDAPEPKPAARVAAFGLWNDSAKDLKFEYRVNGGAWTPMSLEGDEKRVVVAKLAGDAPPKVDFKIGEETHAGRKALPLAAGAKPAFADPELKGYRYRVKP